ncbi:hypothetical protein ACE6H2_020815 [Prunus campanulata]
MEQKTLLPALSCIIFFNLLCFAIAQKPPACQTTCGSLKLKYPFGTGVGCGSPTFQPYIACEITNKDQKQQQQLLLTTHTDSYPITSISYSTQTLTLTPPSMSSCSSMQPSPSNFGLDWASPFQLGRSTFILLSCQPPTSSLTLGGSSGIPVCDPSYSNLCASIYTCPSVVGLGLPLFPPTNTCCVYSPGNLDSKGELDLCGLKCAGYTSVVSLGDYPTDPTRWEYGVTLKYSHGDLDSGIVDTKCNSCEMSDGVCGYRVDDHSFLCVCKNGYNTSSDCNNNFSPDQDLFWGSASNLPPAWKMWFALVVFWEISYSCFDLF